LDKTPDEGFTYEVLTQRSELLRLTADLLTDPESRREYDNLLLNGASGLEFSSNREVAGLILLWESGAPKEAFRITRKALQPPQTPALGSSREADLTLLAALAARDSAIKEQQLRSYSNAAEFLQEGIQLLQRMGKLGERRKELEEDLISQSAPCASLDAHARGEEDRSTLGELIPDPNGEEPMEGMDRTIQKEHLGTWLSQLNEREQKIMKLRFGLDGAEPLTLAEIGRQINVSRERVRQLEAKAILKLRVMTTHQKAA